MAEYTSRAAAYDQNIKLLLIGDSGVGKTCLMLRYAQDMFSPTFITTVGIDYKYKFVTIDGKKIRLEIWDTAGQERFKAITRSYLRGAQGILLTYDVTDRKSFLHVDHWMSQIMQYAELTVRFINYYFFMCMKINCNTFIKYDIFFGYCERKLG